MRNRLSGASNLFVDGGVLRPIWRAVLYFAIGSWIVFPIADRIWAAMAGALHVGTSLSAATIAFYELEILIVAAIVTGMFAWYERRRIDDYGLPVSAAFGRLFWEGLALGIAWAGLDALGMLALGGMKISGLALHGATLVTAALAWAGANLVVGISEEFWYRSYFLQTLWKSLGFWPAAIVISLIFTSDHYFFKSGENLYDVVSLIGFGLFACYTVLRTGSLWFAVGAHVAFDFMQLFVIGTPNGSQIPVNHLLNVSFTGPAWLTGGVLGTEASVLQYPTTVLAFLYVALRFRPARQR
jgi:membrane protease YdiL (CAAX protease family)